jgi:hypothetical protein
VVVVNLNVQKVHARLEERLRMGRTAVEAAGEVRWITDAQQREGLLSKGTHDEVIGIIDDWLACKMEVSRDDVAPYSRLAASYARHLTETVNINDYSRLPTAQIEVAWRQRRETNPAV